jgi:propanol-preferring alcohol dehydrogenase
MLTVQMLGNEKVAVRELPDPEPEGSLVVVKIMASAICGSEIGAYRGRNRMEHNSGHEASGIVYKTDRPKYLKEGDRVMLFAQSHCGRCQHCRAGYWILCQNPSPRRYPGNHSQYVLLDEELCLPLPQDISFEVGALLGDAIGTPYHAIKRLEVTALDTVLICGQGPIGLHATLICKFFNALVIAVDINDYRLELAKSIGADYTFNPQRDNVLEAVRDITGGLGVDKAMDCTGKAEGELLALEAVKRRGKMAFIGENSQGVTINPSRHLIRKDLDVIGSWYFSAAEYDDMIRIVRRGVPIERLITHQFPITEAQKAFETFASGKAAKVLIRPWG